MKNFYIIFWIIVIVVIGGVIIYLGQSSASLSAQNQASTTTAFIPDSTSSAQMISTVPSNGDKNPYGVAFVPTNFPSGGKISPGDILISNWNNSQDLQGKGTTIVDISASSGQPTVFFKGTVPLGLTTALAVLNSGYVIVGNLPLSDGTGATANAGSLLVIDKQGKLIATLTDSNLINGPWYMTVNDNGNKVQTFVSNVLSGSVTRFDLTFGASGIISHSGTIVASGYGHHTDPSAAVVGPTGLVYDAQSDTLFVASTVDNAIYTVANAGTATTSLGIGKVLYKDNTHLHGPLALVKALNGNFIVTNGDAINTDKNHPSEMVEFTSTGKFVKQMSLDSGIGGAFGLGVNIFGGVVTLAAVNDNTSSLLVWTRSQ